MQRPIHKKVKILILTNDSEDVSLDMKSHIDKFSAELKENEYEIVYKNETPKGEREVAGVINDDKFDVVLIDEKVSLSAWEIARQCPKARFYIDGEVGSVVKRELLRDEFSGAISIDKFDADGSPQPLVREVLGDSNRSAEHPIPNTMDTRFCIGSTTKMLTAVAVVMAAEKLKLDPQYENIDVYHLPIKVILKRLNPEYPHIEIFKDFTLHELLTHTSGIDGGIEEPVLKVKMITINGLDGYLPWVEEAIGDEKIQSRRGDWCYSNAGIVMLGFAIEAMTKTNYYEYVRENILTPIGMVHTAEQRQSGDPEYSISYEVKPLLPSETQMKWLEQKAVDDKSPMKKFAVMMRDLLKNVDDINENHLKAQELINDYQAGLLEHQDEKSFSAFRTDFAKKLEEFYSFCDQDKYTSPIKRLLALNEELNKWIKVNEGNPECEDAKKLQNEILQPIINNLNWPIQVIHSLIINLSISHPAGKLYSTASDMLAFQNALWTKNGILAKYADILLPQIEIAKNEYGYGTMMFNENRTPGYGHFGGAGGARASCVSYRDPGFSVVTCSNDNKTPFHVAEQLDRFLVFGSDHGMQYLDKRMSPNSAMSLVEDIRKIQKSKTSHTYSTTAKTALILGMQPSQLPKPTVDDKKDESSPDYSKMSYEELDQTQGKGFRALAEAGKHEEAGRAIKAYCESNTEKMGQLTPSQRCLLWFHGGQSFAQAGMLEEARACFEKAREKDALVDILGPAANIYLQATVAFLSKDTETVRRCLDEILKIPLSVYPPTSNLVFIPGRIHDMATFPDISYKELFDRTPTLPPETPDGEWFPVKSWLDQSIRLAGVPGASLSVVIGDAAIESKQSGITDVTNPQPVTNNTVFEAASLSKPVFAYLVLKLIEQGKFSKPGESPESGLDRPLHEISDFGPPHMRADPRYKLLTARMLLSHQAGLPNEFGSLEGERYIADPQTRFDYSGEAYRFLNNVVEHVAGKTLSELSRERFNLLEMHHSSFTSPAAGSAEETMRAVGHFSDGKKDEREHFPRQFPPHPAASLRTTSEDYAKFLQACMQDKFIKQHMFHQEIALAKTDHKAMGAGVPSSSLQAVSWGLGMGLQKTDEGLIAFHWGDVNTNRSFCAINLDTNKAIVCLTNSANGPAIFKQVAEPIVGNLSPALTWLAMREGLPTVKLEPISKSDKKPCVLVLSSSDEFTAASIKQLNGCDCHVSTASDLSADKLHELYAEHMPDMIVIDGRCVSSASVCSDFNSKLLASNPEVQLPRLYLDTTQSPHLVPEYFKEHKVCGTVSYTDEGGNPVTYRGQKSPGSDEPAREDNNYNVASASKLFTVLACYFALNGKVNENIKVHPDIKLPEYIRAKINEGVKVEDLMFHQAGMGNYLMKILEMVKSDVPVPIPVLPKDGPPIPLPVIGKDLTLSELAHTLLEDKLNMDLSEQKYSNTGYYVLGLAIETAINEGKKPSDPDWKSFYQYVHEEILVKAGMPNTSHVQTDKSAFSSELDLLLKGQQLPCTSAGMWYSTSDDQYRMMQWVYEKYQSEPQFKNFIDYYNQHDPLDEGKHPDVFMHVGRLDTGANAYVSLNLKSGDIYSVVTNEMQWENSGMQHIVSHESIAKTASEVAKSKGLELDASHEAKVAKVDDVREHTVSPRL